MKKLINIKENNYDEIIQIKLNPFFIDYDKIYIDKLNSYVKKQIINNTFSKHNTFIVVDKSIYDLQNINYISLNSYSQTFDGDKVHFYNILKDKYHYEYNANFLDITNLKHYIDFLKYSKVNILYIYTTLNYTYEEKVLMKLNEISSKL